MRYVFFCTHTAAYVCKQLLKAWIVDYKDRLQFWLTEVPLTRTILNEPDHHL